MLWSLLLLAMTIAGGARSSAQKNPCDELSVGLNYVGPGCCWEFTLNNNFAGTRIGSVTATLLTPGAHVESGSGPFNNATTTLTTITWSFPNYVPNGATNGLRGCFYNPTAGPITVVFTWNAVGSIPCHDTLTFDCPLPPPVDSCATDTLRLNTGWDHATKTAAPEGSYSPFWNVVADPSPNTTEPRPALVVNTFGGWAGPFGRSRWIGTSPGSATGTYAFEACFCMKEGARNPELYLQLLADDRASIYLNGTLIGQTPSSNAFLMPPTVIAMDIAKLVVPGRNCLRVEVENTGGQGMGVDIDGYIVSSGGGILKPNCCSPTGSIIGTKYWDQNLNGKRDPGEPGLPNWTIRLGSGASATTDALGNYYFSNLAPGTYEVGEVQQRGWQQSAPAGKTHTVRLDAGQVAAERDFGNYQEGNQGCFSIIEPKVTCTPNGYQICFQVANGSSFPATYFTVVPTTPAGLTVSPATIAFAPALMPGGTSQQYCMTLSGAGATAGTTVTFIAAMCDITKGQCCVDSIRLVLPKCEIQECCANFAKAFYKVTGSASSNGVTTLAGSLSAGSALMTRVSATIIQSTINGRPAYGYFMPGSGANTILGFGSGSMAVSPYSHEVNWGPAGPVNLNTPTAFSLKMQFPPLAGARDTLRYDIRVRYTDAACVTCDTVIHIERVRRRIIIWDDNDSNPGRILEEKEGNGRSLQSDGPSISGQLHPNDSGSLRIVFPAFPPELGDAIFTGLSIEPEDAGLIGATAAEQGYAFVVANGSASTRFSLEPGSTLNIGLRYASLGGKNSVRHHLVFSYAADGDTLQEDVTVVLRREGLAGDALTPAVPSLGGVRTYGLHLVNSNGSQEPISRLLISTVGAARIMAVGPTASQSAASLSFGETGVGEFGRQGIALNPGASREPIYLTLSGVEGNTTTVHFVTLNAEGQPISEGDVILSSPLSSVRGDEGGDATAGAMLGQSYPNPAGHSATIGFTLPAGSSVTLTLSDPGGREVMRPIDGESLPPGSHVVFLRTDGLASGTYYYTLRAGGRVETRAMQVVK